MERKPVLFGQKVPLLGYKEIIRNTGRVLYKDTHYDTIHSTHL